MKKYKRHKLSGIFPDMKKDDMKKLVDSISKGYDKNHPITLFENQILDGWHRYQASEKSGVDPVFITFEGSTESAHDLVIRENLERRHLSADDKLRIAMRSKEFITVLQTERPKGGDRSKVVIHNFDNKPKTHKVIADKFNVGEKRVAQQIKIEKTAPEVHDAFMDGDISHEDGKKISKLAPDVQTHVIETVKSTDKPKIKDIIKSERDKTRKVETDNYIEQHKEDIIDEPIYLLPCADINLPENSIDLIFTDPPYSPDFTLVYGDLAKLAVKVLKPGALCIAYAGDMYLPDIIDQMKPHLEWVMILNQYMPDSNNPVWATNTTTVIRHMVVFKKPGKTDPMGHVRNTIHSQKLEKDVHKWQQSEFAAATYIPAYTNVGDTVLDPFVGGGTFPVVCKKIGRKYIGYDIDQDAVNITIKRLGGI